MGTQTFSSRRTSTVIFSLRLSAELRQRLQPDWRHALGNTSCLLRLSEMRGCRCTRTHHLHFRGPGFGEIRSAARVRKCDAYGHAAQRLRTRGTYNVKEDQMTRCETGCTAYV